MTPTPSVEPVSLVPQSVLPLDCADMLSLGYIQDRIPGEVLSVSVDQSSAPAGDHLMRFWTAGGLRCVWGGSDRTDGGYGQGLTLNIVANGVSGFEKWVASSRNDAVAWRTDAYGDRSFTHCSEDWQNGCFGGVIVDGYWIDVAVRDSAPRTGATGESRFAELIEPVIAKIRGAGEPRAQWQPPADAYDGAELCADPAIASAAMGGAVTIAPFPTAEPEYYSVFDEAGSRALVTQCIWETSLPGLERITVVLYPAGAWMYPRFVAEPEEAGGSYLSDETIIDIPGADGAITAEADLAWAAVSVRGSLLEVTDGYTYDAATIVPMLERLVAEI